MLGINHVEPGGPPLVLRLSASVSVIKISVGPVDNNAYLLQHSSGGSVLIDAANDADRCHLDQSLLNRWSAFSATLSAS